MFQVVRINNLFRQIENSNADIKHRFRQINAGSRFWGTFGALVGSGAIQRGIGWVRSGGLHEMVPPEKVTSAGELHPKITTDTTFRVDENAVNQSIPGKGAISETVGGNGNAARVATENAVPGHSVPATENPAATKIPGNPTEGHGTPKIAPEVKSFKLRAGASMEINGNSTVLHAGSRGIEGAMIDMEKADPAKYAEMIKKLHEMHPEFKGNEQSLIHKFVIENAQGRDLNNILSAEVSIDDTGVHLGHVGINPNASVTETLQNGPSGSISNLHQPIDFNPNAPVGSPDEIFQAKPGVFDASNAPKLNITPDSSDLEDIPVGAAKSAQEIADLTKQARYEAIQSFVERTGKLSEGLKDVLGEKYRDFMNTLRFPEKALDKIKNLKLEEFVEKMEGEGSESEVFKNTYINILRVVKDFNVGESLKGSDSMKKVLLEVAKKVNEIKS